MKIMDLAEDAQSSIGAVSAPGFTGKTGDGCAALGEARLEPPIHLPISRSGFVSRCICAAEAALLAKYHIHVLTSPDKTVGIILDRRPGALHKYLMARDDQGHEYLLSMPVGWVRRHRNILERLEGATGRLLSVAGGGFVMWAGQLLVYGLSVEFGPGDHNYARDEFSQAIASAPLHSPHRDR
jgi:hypothetical protein